VSAEKLLDWFFPRRCPFCGRVNLSDLPCGNCQKTLPWLLGPSARSHVEFIEDAVSALEYRGAVRGAVLGLKFGKKLARAKPLGLLIGQCVQDQLAEPFDLVSWPSLSGKHRRKRGFDQGERLAKEAAAVLGTRPTRLFVKEDRPAQSGLKDPAERRANVLGAYRLRDPEAVRGKRILLIDDVLTTGATLSECARVLRAAGAESVCAATLAKAGPGRARA
jgi:ComF family protein